LQDYFHENIKYHVSLAYMQLAIGLMHLNGVMNEENKFKWIKGAPDGSPIPIQVTEYLN